MRVRRPIAAVIVCAVTLLAAGCGDGSDGVLDDRETYVRKQMSSMKAQLRDRAEGHDTELRTYANCMYDVIEANRDELEEVKDSDSQVARILAEKGTGCLTTLEEEIGS